MKALRTLFVSAAAVGLLVTAAQAQDKTIKIGALFPMSGPGSYFGAQDKQGVELALEQLNKAGVNGYKFDVQYEDSSCSPLPATQAAKRLIEQFKPDVMIGEECSDATLAVMPVMEQAKVPLLNAGSSAIKVTEPGNPWTFRIMPNEVMQGVDLAAECLQALERATPRCCCTRTPMPASAMLKVFKETFTKLGGKILAEIGFGRDVNDFTSIATRVAGLGKVDVIPTYTLEGQGLKITQALAQAGVTKGGGGKAIQIGTIWLPFGFEQKAGKAALGYIRIVQFDPTDQRDVAQNFVGCVQGQIQRGSDAPQRACLRPDHADRRRGQARRQGRPIDPRRSCRDERLLGRDRQRRVRQDQPEHQDGHHPLHGDPAGHVVEGLKWN